MPVLQYQSYGYKYSHRATVPSRVTETSVFALGQSPTRRKVPSKGGCLLPYPIAACSVWSYKKRADEPQTRSICQSASHVIDDLTGEPRFWFPGIPRYCENEGVDGGSGNSTAPVVIVSDGLTFIRKMVKAGATSKLAL